MQSLLTKNTMGQSPLRVRSRSGPAEDPYLLLITRVIELTCEHLRNPLKPMLQRDAAQCVLDGGLDFWLELVEGTAEQQDRQKAHVRVLATQVLRPSYVPAKQATGRPAQGGTPKKAVIQGSGVRRGRPRHRLV